MSIDIIGRSRSASGARRLLSFGPGGDILSRFAGWPEVERVLELVDAVEALGIDPADTRRRHQA